MPALKNYRLFISHSWTYSDKYEKLTSLLAEYPLFKWSNYSVPKDDPIHNAPNASQLESAIEQQMRLVNCVLILAGVYSTYSKWIQREIAIAKRLGKPIIAIEPFASERTSAVVKDNADAVVKWNSNSIVDAIRNLSI